jgi:hypothetical protein
MKTCGDGVSIEAHPLFQEEGSGAKPTSPLQLTIQEIDMRTACVLNKKWHSLLPRTDLGNMLAGNTSVAYAAYFEGRYYAVAIFSQPIIRAIAKDGKTIELRRLAICAESPKNTASRMLSVCRKLVKKKYPQMEKCVSYLAIDHHKGTIYKASGWRQVGVISSPRPQRKTGDHGRATGPLQTHSRKQRWEIEL